LSDASTVTRKPKKEPLATQVVDAIEEEAAKKGEQRESRREWAFLAS
jgi:hypothetical protein